MPPGSNLFAVSLSLQPWKKKCEFFKADVVGKLHNVLSNGVYIDTLNLMPGIQDQIRSLTAFDNPKFFGRGKRNYMLVKSVKAIYDIHKREMA